MNYGLNTSICYKQEITQQFESCVTLDLPEKAVHNSTSDFWELNEKMLVKYLRWFWWMQERHSSLEQAARMQIVQLCVAAVRAAGFSLAAGDGRADKTWD